MIINIKSNAFRIHSNNIIANTINSTNSICTNGARNITNANIHNAITISRNNNIAIYN
jgi:hypothetical protein